MFPRITSLLSASEFAMRVISKSASEPYCCLKPAIIWFISSVSSSAALTVSDTVPPFTTCFIPFVSVPASVPSVAAAPQPVVNKAAAVIRHKAFGALFPMFFLLPICVFTPALCQRQCTDMFQLFFTKIYYIEYIVHFAIFKYPFRPFSA